MKRITYLLGAGSSKHAGFPLANELLSEIEAKRDYLFTNDHFQLQGNYPVGDPDLRDKAQNIIHAIKSQLEKYHSRFNPPRQVTYEQIASEINLMYDPFDRLSILPFKKMIAEELGYTTSDFSFEINSSLEYAKKFIEAVVYRLTVNDPIRNSIDHILEGIQSNYEISGILSLNYDVNVEILLEREKVEYVDGFDDKSLPEWRPELLRKDGFLSLLKLHGSVTWWEAFFDGGDYWSLFKSRLRPDGRICNYILEHPKILIGTENKILKYVNSPYSFLRAEAMYLLERTEILVSVGYGFGDNGINSMITDWFYRHPDRNLLVVDPQPEGLRSRVFQFGKGWFLQSSSEKLKFADIVSTISTQPQQLRNP